MISLKGSNTLSRSNDLGFANETERFQKKKKKKDKKRQEKERA
jgi:hypothetical protein